MDLGKKWYAVIAQGGLLSCPLRDGRRGSTSGRPQGQELTWRHPVHCTQQEGTQHGIYDAQHTHMQVRWYVAMRAARTKCVPHA